MPSPRSLTIAILLASMEVLAAFAVIVGSSLLDLAQMSYTAFWLFWLAALIGLAVGTTVGASRLGGNWSRAALLLGGIGTTLIIVALSRSVQTMLVGGILLAVFYWRGLLLSGDDPGLADVQLRFGFGFSLLFVGLVWVIARGIIDQRAIWYMLAVDGIAFTVLAMTALTLVRLERTREPGTGPAILLTVGVQLGLVVFVAILALQLFALNLATLSWHFSHPAFDAVGAAGFHLVQLIAGPIDRFLSLIRPHGHHVVRPRIVAPTPSKPHSGKRPVIHHTSALALVLAAILVLLAFLAGVGYLVWKAIPRIPHRRPQTGFQEERAPVITLAELWQLLLAWFRSMLRDGGGAMLAVLQRNQRRIFPAYPTDPVRRVYAQLLRRAGLAGLPRAPQTTPAEYVELLSRRWPGGAPAFTAITNAYVERRYGEIPIHPLLLGDLRGRWNEARVAIRLTPALLAGGRSEDAEPVAKLPTSPRLSLESLRTSDGRRAAIGLAGVFIVRYVAPVAVLIVLLLAITVLAGHH